MLNVSTLISVQAIIMSVHTHVHVYAYSVKLDCIHVPDWKWHAYIMEGIIMYGILIVT